MCTPANSSDISEGNCVAFLRPSMGIATRTATWRDNPREAAPLRSERSTILCARAWLCARKRPCSTRCQWVDADWTPDPKVDRGTGLVALDLRGTSATDNGCRARETLSSQIRRQVRKAAHHEATQHTAVAGFVGNEYRMDFEHTRTSDKSKPVQHSSSPGMAEEHKATPCYQGGENDDGDPHSRRYGGG